MQVQHAGPNIIINKLRRKTKVKQNLLGPGTNDCTGHIRSCHQTKLSCQNLIFWCDFGKRRPNILQHFLSPISPSIWQSLVDYSQRRLTKKLHLWTVGKYECPTFSRFWSKHHEILGNCREPSVVCNSYLIVYITLRYEDICNQVSKSLKDNEKYPRFFRERLSQIFMTVC